MAVLWRLVRKSARARWRSLLLVAGVLALTTASTAALLGLVVGAGDLSGRAALAFGPNLVVEPKAALRASADASFVEVESAAPATFLEGALARLGALRHGDRITAASAVLEGALVADASTPEVPMAARLVPVLGTWLSDRSGEIGLPAAATRASDVYSWWKVEGAWPQSDAGGAASEALVGRRAAQALRLHTGDAFFLLSADGNASSRFKVSGILSTGDGDEERVVVDLGVAQALLSLKGRVSRAYLAVAVVPDDDLARLDPDRMTDRQYQQWYCTPYLGSVARQVSEAVAGAQARPLRQVSGVNAQVAGRLAAFAEAMVLVVGAACAVAVGAATAARELDRARESALFLALGATAAFARRLTLAENLVAALGGALGGAIAGTVLSGLVTRLAFGAALPPSPAALLGAVALTLLCALGGSRAALRVLSKHTLSASLRGS